MQQYKNLISGFMMLVFGACVTWVLIPAGVVEPKSVKYAALSPSYYPRIVAIALMLLGAGIMLRAWLQPTAVVSNDDRHPEALKRTLCFLAILIALALTLNWLGFVVASALALCLALVLGGEKRLFIIATLAILFPLALYFFFLKVARIPIPLGILEPWLAGI